MKHASDIIYKQEMEHICENVYYIVQLFGDDKEIAELGKVGFGSEFGIPYEQSMDYNVILPIGGKLLMFYELVDIAGFIALKETRYPNIDSAIYLITEGFVMKLDRADLVRKPIDNDTA